MRVTFAPGELAAAAAACRFSVGKSGIRLEAPGGLAVYLQGPVRADYRRPEPTGPHEFILYQADNARNDWAAVRLQHDWRTLTISREHIQGAPPELKYSAGHPLSVELDSHRLLVRVDPAGTRQVPQVEWQRTMHRYATEWQWSYNGEEPAAEATPVLTPLPAPAPRVLPLWHYKAHLLLRGGSNHDISVYVHASTRAGAAAVGAREVERQFPGARVQRSDSTYVKVVSV